MTATPSRASDPFEASFVAAQQQLHPSQGAGASFWADDSDWIEEALSPRPWVVPGFAMRGAVTVLAGMGSAGKSSLVISWAVASALGQDFGRFAPPAPLKVLVYNAEDDGDEQKRRLSASLRQFGRAPKDLAGRVIRCGPEGVGTLIERDPAGNLAPSRAWEALSRLLRQKQPDIVVLDPLVELHTADENDNTSLRLVMAHLRTLARDHRCAVVVVHHTRKGAAAGEVDAIRGAGSLVAASRAAFTLTPMTEEEANELGVLPRARRAYVRLDSVKQNYAPAAGDADWHHLQDYELDNGEWIAAMHPWSPPSASRGQMPETMALIEAAIERGVSGSPYSPRLAVEQARSIASLLTKHEIRSAQAQKATLRRLMESGFSVQEYRTANGDVRQGIRSPAGLPEARWVA